MTILPLLSIMDTYAHSIDVSRSCMRMMPSSMSYLQQLRQCENVADLCYRHFSKRKGIVQAADFCKNTAASCYRDLTRELPFSWHNRAAARLICLDVANSCYQSYRDVGFSIPESITSCSGSSHH